VLFVVSHVNFNHSWHSCVLEEKGTGIFLFYPHVGKETEKLGIIKKVLPKSCNHKITGFAAGEEKVKQHCRDSARVNCGIFPALFPRNKRKYRKMTKMFYQGRSRN
jgi:hypothetical protein